VAGDNSHWAQMTFYRIPEELPLTHRGSIAFRVAINDNIFHSFPRPSLACLPWRSAIATEVAGRREGKFGKMAPLGQKDAKCALAW